MTPMLTRHRFDPTGKNPNNYVREEPHPLKLLGQRTLIPTCGSFYEEGFILFDPSTQKPLIKGEQYHFEHLYPEPSALTGKAVYGSAVITDKDVGNFVEMSYQAVGGQYANVLHVIENLLEVLKNDTRPATWDNVDGKPSSFKPVHHLHDIGDTYGWDRLVLGVERLAAGVRLTDTIEHDAFFKNIDERIASLNVDGVSYGNQLIAAHLAQPNPHAQYALRTDIADYLDPIRQPVVKVPSAGQTNVPMDVTLQMDRYLSAYRVPLATTQFQVSTVSDFSNTVIDASIPSSQASYHYNGALSPNTVYYVRGRFTDVEGVTSKWSPVTQFRTIAVSVAQPLITSPLDGAETTIENVTIYATAFAITGASDSHASSDWEIWTGPNGSGTRVFASTANTVNKTNITIPIGTFVRGQTYYPRVRYRSANYGTSVWSANMRFIALWSLRPTVMGQAYGGGYWVGDTNLPDGTYAIIMAPKAAGESQKQLQSPLGSLPGATSITDSAGNTTALAGVTSPAAAWVRSLNIGGFTDWQIPAKQVLADALDNVTPANPNTPALFATGGSEALVATAYWTSTCRDWVSDDSYYDQGPPIYETIEEPYSTGGSGWKLDGPTCYGNGVATNVESYGEPQDLYNNGLMYTFYTWTCEGTKTKTVIVGYEQGEYHEEYTDHYDAYAIQAIPGNPVNEIARSNSRYIRAVRLVKVA